MFLGHLGRVPRRGPAQRFRLRVATDSYEVGHAIALANRAVR
ncbi:hypothetical protein [Streptomyces sp. NEAU-174]